MQKLVTFVDNNYNSCGIPWLYLPSEDYTYYEPDEVAEIGRRLIAYVDTVFVIKPMKNAENLVYFTISLDYKHTLTHKIRFEFVYSRKRVKLSDATFMSELEKKILGVGKGKLVDENYDLIDLEVYINDLHLLRHF